MAQASQPAQSGFCDSAFASKDCGCGRCLTLGRLSCRGTESACAQQVYLPWYLDGLRKRSSRSTSCSFVIAALRFRLKASRKVLGTAPARLTIWMIVKYILLNSFMDRSVYCQTCRGLTSSNKIPPTSASAPTTGGMKWLWVVSMCTPRKSIGFPGVEKLIPE